MDKTDEMRDAALRLDDIRIEIEDLVEEAMSIFRAYGLDGQFKGYAYASIITALSDDHQFLGGNMVPMQELINTLYGRIGEDASEEE